MSNANPLLGSNLVDSCKALDAHIASLSGDENEVGKIEPTTFETTVHTWAARTFLELTNLRIERLHDITEDDAKAEGVDPYEWAGGPANPAPIPAFRELWDALNAKRAPWASNPWVWRIAFKRIEASAP